MIKWISVADKKPELSSMVIGYVSGEVVPLMCNHDGNAKYFSFVTHYGRCHPSHWMPLPTPPENV